jgi:ketosteroid isomerase-like protein
MKRSTLTAATLLLAGFMLAQAAERDEVAKAEQAWAKAALTGDAAALDKLLAADLVYTHASGVVENRSVYFNKIKSGAVKYDKLEQVEVVVRPLGGVAIVHSKAHMRAMAAGKPIVVDAVLMHIWVKRGGEWKLAAHQATNLPQTQ